jgi:hypothetical protein
MAPAIPHIWSRASFSQHCYATQLFCNTCSRTDETLSVKSARPIYGQEARSRPVKFGPADRKSRWTVISRFGPAESGLARHGQNRFGVAAMCRSRRLPAVRRDLRPFGRRRLKDCPDVFVPARSRRTASGMPHASPLQHHPAKRSCLTAIAAAQQQSDHEVLHKSGILFRQCCWLALQ